MSKKGYSDVVLGLQFGDEGKARVVDFLAPNYDIIARFNGGSNAGHTIKYKNKKVALQQVPSGIFYPKQILYIGSGCVVNLIKLVKEIQTLEETGIILKNRLKISCQASIIQPHHLILDEIMGKVIGTTKNGIGPAYADKATRMEGDRLVSIRLADLIDNPKMYGDFIKKNLLFVAKTHKIKIKNPDAQINEIIDALTSVKNYVEMDPLYLQKKVEKGSKVLFEGAQSAMLDVSRGSVPFVTSSSTLASAAYVGGDLPVFYHRKTIGIAKAVMSRVGNGPFPSEYGGKKSEIYCIASEKDGRPKYRAEVEEKLDVERLLTSGDSFKIGMALRILSGEYGTRTTRPRRIGMFDLVQLSYSSKMNGVDELIINKCDTLSFYGKTKKRKIPVVNDYKLDNKTIDYLPSSSDATYRVLPNVVYWNAFTRDITNIRKFADLPKELKEFIANVEKATDTKVTGIGVGPERDQFIKR